MYLGRRIKRNHCLGWADNAEEGQRCVAPAASISQFAQEKEWKERGKCERKVPSENPCSQSVSVPEPFRAIGPTYVGDLYSPYYAFLFRLLVLRGVSSRKGITNLRRRILGPLQFVLGLRRGRKRAPDKSRLTAPKRRGETWVLSK